MQKGVFTTWIKELCALVFVQTIQAFILAIVISIIITFISPNASDDKIAKLTDADSVSALGILCIVLLTSLTKMEQITKKIFGLDSGILQNKPPHGLAATMLALKSVGRVFNNVPKMIGGIGSATLGAGLDKKKARSAMLGRLNRKGIGTSKDTNEGESQDLNSTNVSGNYAKLDNAKIAQDFHYNKMKKAKNEGNMEDYKKHRQLAADAMKERKRLEQENSQGDLSQGAPTARSAPKLVDDKTRDNYDKIMEKYEDDLAKAKEKRRKGIENFASGAAETLGAGIGGMTGLSIGAISGLATGDLDQIPKAAAYGIGVGDAAGENLAKAVTAAASGIRSRAKVNSNLDKQLAQMERNLKINNEHRGSQAKRVKNITQKIEKDIGLQ